MISRPQRLIVCFCFILLFVAAGCQKRYWYRKKVRDPYTYTPIPKAKPKQLYVYTENASPAFISSSFQNDILNLCKKELTRKGYVVSESDTPALHLLIRMQVDSYYVYGRTLGRYHSIVVKKPLQQGQYPPYLVHQSVVKELAFEYVLEDKKNGLEYWRTRDGLYFFNKESKDQRRSRGIVKYNLNGMPE